MKGNDLEDVSWQVFHVETDREEAELYTDPKDDDEEQLESE